MQPLLERLICVNHDFQFPVTQSPDKARLFRREGNLHPLPIQAERVGQLEDTTDVRERDNL
ncbi:MAG TPA: hypothetical protein VLD60_07605 [Nitrospira sp.]|nr:hypothetical protein [Nitrospira sp.]